MAAGSPSETEKKMKSFFNIDQAENDASNGGGTGSQDGGANGAAGAGAAAGAEGAAAQGGASGGAANQNAGNAGGNAGAAWEQREVDWNGQKVAVKTWEEAKALIQKGYNVTQREQELSGMRKSLLAKMARFEQLEAERAKKAGNNDGEAEGGEGADDPIKLMQSRQDKLEDELKIEKWNKVFEPISKEYPDVPEMELIDAFRAKKLALEVEDTTEGLMQVAQELSEQHTGRINQRLETALTDPKSKVATDYAEKIITTLLADTNNPRLKTYNKTVIDAYLAGKLELAEAGGDNGGRGNGAGTGSEKVESIAEIAARQRA